MDGVSSEDVGRVAELERKVKEKEEEIKRLRDEGLDSEEKLTGLQYAVSWKEKEIKRLRENVQKTDWEFEDFQAVAKAEAKKKDRLGLIEKSRQSDERREEKKKIRELQGEKGKLELTIRDLEGSLSRRMVTRGGMEGYSVVGHLCCVVVA